MNHHLIDVAVTAVLIIGGLAGAFLSLPTDQPKRKRPSLSRLADPAPLPGERLREAMLDAQLRHDLNAEAEAIYQDDMPSPDMAEGYRWPDEFCSYPPCEREDNWVCSHHSVRLAAERVGRHRAPWSEALDAQPAHIIQAVVTDVQERGKQ